MADLTAQDKQWLAELAEHVAGEARPPRITRPRSPGGRPLSTLWPEEAEANTEYQTALDALFVLLQYRTFDLPALWRVWPTSYTRGDRCPKKCGDCPGARWCAGDSLPQRYRDVAYRLGQLCQAYPFLVTLADVLDERTANGKPTSKQARVTLASGHTTTAGRLLAAVARAWFHHDETAAWALSRDRSTVTQLANDFLADAGVTRGPRYKKPPPPKELGSGRHYPPSKRILNDPDWKKEVESYNRLVCFPTEGPGQNDDGGPGFLRTTTIKADDPDPDRPRFGYLTLFESLACTMENKRPTLAIGRITPRRSMVKIWQERAEIENDAALTPFPVVSCAPKGDLYPGKAPPEGIPEWAKRFVAMMADLRCRVWLIPDCPLSNRHHTGVRIHDKRPMVKVPESKPPRLVQFAWYLENVLAAVRALQGDGTAEAEAYGNLLDWTAPRPGKKGKKHPAIQRMRIDLDQWAKTYPPNQRHSYREWLTERHARYRLVIRRCDGLLVTSREIRSWILEEKLYQANARPE